jgi:hypothetical protein
MKEKSNDDKGVWPRQFIGDALALNLHFHMLAFMSMRRTPKALSFFIQPLLQALRRWGM